MVAVALEPVTHQRPGVTLLTGLPPHEQPHGEEREPGGGPEISGRITVAAISTSTSTAASMMVWRVPSII
jgi:hypothetical protein